jgi:hypothetical protein
MNTAYASPPRDMHPRATMPSIHDPAYRAAPAPTGPPYSMPHTMAPIQPPHQQLSAYEQYNNTLPLSRPPPPEHLGSSEALSSTSPGAHPPNPIPRSLTDGGRRYEYVPIGRDCPSPVLFGDSPHDLLILLSGFTLLITSS